MTTFFGTYFSVKKNFDLWKSGRRSRRASERINKYSTAPGVIVGRSVGPKRVYDESGERSGRRAVQLFHLFRVAIPDAVFIILITIISTPNLGDHTMSSNSNAQIASQQECFNISASDSSFLCCLLIYGDVPLRRLCEIRASSSCYDG